MKWNIEIFTLPFHFSNYSESKILTWFFMVTYASVTVLTYGEGIHHRQEYRRATRDFGWQGSNHQKGDARQFSGLKAKGIEREVSGCRYCHV